MGEPHPYVRNIIRLARDGKLYEGAGRCAGNIGRAFPSAARAWAQFVLYDAWRFKRQCNVPLTFTTCLEATDVVCEAVGFPPPLSCVFRASCLTLDHFVTAVGRGRVSFFAMCIRTPEDAELVNLAVSEAVASSQDRPLFTVGFIWRALYVTARRCNGERIRFNYFAALWTDASRTTLLPLSVLRHMLKRCGITEDAVGVYIAMASTGRTSAWLDAREWNRYGIHNFVLDVLSLWANVMHRRPVRLGPWATECCSALEAAVQPPGPPVHLREYDPGTDRYFACWAGLSSPGRWLQAAETPAELKTVFVHRRAVMRAASVGETLGLLLTVAGEIGSRFARSLGETLQQHLLETVPGDRGLLNPMVLAHARTSITAPEQHLAWHAVNKLPWVAWMAVGCDDAATTGAGFVLRLVKLAMRSPKVALPLLELANLISAEKAAVDLQRTPALIALTRHFPPECCPKAVLAAALCAVCGTQPEIGKHSCTTAIIAAFNAPSSDVESVLAGLLRLTDPAGSVKRIHAVLGVLDSYLPEELHVLILRHWIVVEALAVS